MTKLTELQIAALKGIAESDYQNSIERTDWVWSCSCDKYLHGKQLSGAISSLCKKGLALTDGGYGSDACICLTPAGALEYDKLKVAAIVAAQTAEMKEFDAHIGKGELVIDYADVE